MKKELNKNFWNQLVEKSTKIEVYTADFSIIDKDLFKKLRNELNFSQSKFAKILGVSKKTIEKWEQGVNPIKGPASRLVFLLYNDHALIDQFYKKRLMHDSHDLYGKVSYYFYNFSHVSTSTSVLTNAKYQKNEMAQEGGFDIWKKTVKDQCLAS